MSVAYFIILHFGYNICIEKTSLDTPPRVVSLGLAQSYVLITWKRKPHGFIELSSAVHTSKYDRVSVTELPSALVYVTLSVPLLISVAYLTFVAFDEVSP